MRVGKDGAGAGRLLIAGAVSSMIEAISEQGIRPDRRAATAGGVEVNQRHADLVFGLTQAFWPKQACLPIREHLLRLCRAVSYRETFLFIRAF